MSRPRLLDLFCGAGGAAMGYYRAGFDVVGVDLAPQKHYPFEFHQADALTYPLDGFDVIHASPPCQGYSVTRFVVSTHGKRYPMLLDATRSRLARVSIPWVIENVKGAPMPNSIELCGTAFGLPTRRHRLFESSMLLFAAGTCRHQAGDLGIYGEGVHRLATRGATYRNRDGRLFARPLKATAAEGRRAMGIDWMALHELCEAIPPAYTEWIGRQLLAALALREAV